MAAAPEDAGQEQEVNAPVVFFCASCHHIVGDTLAFACANEGLQAITLTAACSVARDAELITSHEEHDLGSTYQRLRCENCSSVLGRVYLTTPRRLDSLRDLYTFSTAALGSYELGSSKSLPWANARFLSSDHESQLQQLRTEVFKVQRLMLVWEERIRGLEQQAVGSGDARDSGEPPSAPQAAHASHRKRPRRKE